MTKRIGLFALWALVRAVATFRPRLVIPAPDRTAYMTRWHLTPGRLEARPRTLPSWVVAPWWARFVRRIGCPGWSMVALHCLHQSDPDRGLHNHPYTFARALVLRGGYVERVLDSDDMLEAFYVRRPGAVNRIPADRYHAVYLLGEHTPSWSLFCAGPKHGNGWGFVKDGDGVAREIVS